MEYVTTGTYTLQKQSGCIDNYYEEFVIIHSWQINSTIKHDAGRIGEH